MSLARTDTPNNPERAYTVVREIVSGDYGLMTARDLASTRILAIYRTFIGEIDSRLSKELILYGEDNTQERAEQTKKRIGKLAVRFGLSGPVEESLREAPEEIHAAKSAYEKLAQDVTERSPYSTVGALVLREDINSPLADVAVSYNKKILDSDMNWKLREMLLEGQYPMTNELQGAVTRDETTLRNMAAINIFYMHGYAQEKPSHAAPDIPLLVL